MRKRIICLLLLLIFTLSLASCDLFVTGDPNNGGNSGGSGDNSGDGSGDGSDDGSGDGSENENGTTGSEKIINVYLIAGQSNAVGYGMDTAGSIAKSDKRFTEGFENVIYYGSQERWNGSYPNKNFAPVKLGMGVSHDRSGAEIGIASAIADNGEMNAIIKCAWGATHIYPDSQYEVSLKQGTWTSPSYIENNNVDLSENELIGNMYNRFEQTVKDGLTLLIEDGYTPVIKGVWWMQGEAEMFTLEMASAYRELYKTLILDMRDLLSETTGYDCSEVPFVCGLPKWNTKNSPPPSYQGMVRTAMQTVSDELTNVGYVDCMPLNQHDDWHFDAAGQKYLGEQFISCVEEFEVSEIFKEKISIDSEIKLLAAERGLEFKAGLTSYNSKNNHKYGFIIVPTSKLTENNIKGQYIETLDSLGIEYKNILCEVAVEKIDEDYSDIYFGTKLSDIAYEDINTSYTAIAYIKNEYGNYLYSSSNISCSLAGLASKKMYEEEGRDELLAIVNAGISQLAGLPEGSSDAAFEILAEENQVVQFSEAASKYQLPVTNSLGADYFVKFTSADPSVASIDESGLITAHKLGETEILIECAGRSKSINLSVQSVSVGGVELDGVISDGEYVGSVIMADNGNVSAEVVGMVKEGNLYLAFELVHGEWSPFNGSWWLNDNVEFKLNGESHTVVFYEGEPTYSSNISYGMSKTEEIDGKLVTTIEVCVENVPEVNQIMLCANGTNFGWLAIVHHDVCNTGYINENGIIVAQPIELGNGIILDGKFDESAYTEEVKSNAISANGNGAEIDIIGTLTDKGVLLGVTINHAKSPYETVIYNGDWYTFMNIEFHFNNNGAEADQFMFFANNRQKVAGDAFSYSSVAETAGGYTSTIEIFISYESIGVSAGVESVDFTARGWFENGWCDLLNNSWNATHTITANGLAKL